MASIAALDRCPSPPWQTWIATRAGRVAAASGAAAYDDWEAMLDRERLDAVVV